ncbi:MAG: hypothetical protein Fur0012_02770 [Elusimicrobiota bacterium]
MLLSYYRRPIVILFSVYCIFLFSRYFFFSQKGQSLLYEQDELCGRVLSYAQETRGYFRFDFSGIYAGEEKKFSAYLKNGEGLIPMEEICFKANISSPYSSFAAGMLDWREFLAKRGIFLEARGNSFTVKKKAPAVFRLAYAVRKKVLESFENNLGLEKSAVLSGIVIGYKKKMDPLLQDAFSISGTVHILVASGGNVAVVTGFCLAVLRLLGFPFYLSFLAGLLGSAFYVFVCGMDPPLTRAFFMTLAGSLAFFVQRKKDPFQMLILASFAILLINPRYILDAGFQMSFAAVYGLAAGFGARKFFFSKKRPKLISFANTLFFASFFAQLALSPLLIIYFNRISLVGFAANVIAVPLAGLLLPLGLAAVVFCSVPFLGHILFQLCDFFLSILIKSVFFFSSLPFASIAMPDLSIAGCIALCSLVFLILHWPILPFKRFAIFICLFLMAAGLLSQFYWINRELKIDFSRDGRKGFFISRCGHLFVVEPWNSCREIEKAAYSLGFTNLEAAFYAGKPDADTALCLKKEMSARIFAPLWHSGELAQGVWPGEKYFEILRVRGKREPFSYSGRKDEIEYVMLP